MFLKKILHLTIREISQIGDLIEKKKKKRNEKKEIIYSTNVNNTDRLFLHEIEDTECF